MAAISLTIEAADPASGLVTLGDGSFRAITALYDASGRATLDSEDAVACSVELDDGAYGLLLLEDYRPKCLN
ncbi:hypothetical protein [Pelagibacterium montanilacus]|uniref:hypothetical protein n=1 Tax=Pelagibacterium montanilacus TaxID=2185280 RepID=UPI000F8F7A54|nr:hypothetical protein [Pelagibacterium montanilacus]